MKIYLVNHYAVPPKYYPLSRPSLFAKNLMKMGHDVTIVASSSVHNSKGDNLINDGSEVKHIIDDGVSYVLIRCVSYCGNSIKRVINIGEFANKLSKVLNKLDKPDVIIATSFDPISCYAGIKYAKKNNIKAISEIADLWPETLVAYSGISKNNLFVKWLRKIEKKIYMLSDAIIFTMEGAYDYIVEQDWDKDISRSKVFYINNGIDLETFDFNKTNFQIDDDDLENQDTYKIVYTGSIRKVNNLGKLLDVAREIKNQSIKFLIWGDGDQLNALKQRIVDENIDNVIFKGKVEKKYVPYITSHADLNYAHNDSSPLFRFGISFNKIFDYLAAGKPIICDFYSKYNPVIQENAGLAIESGDIKEIAKVIEKMSNENSKYIKEMSNNARKAANKYDFKNLTNKLIEVINNVKE